MRADKYVLNKERGAGPGSDIPFTGLDVILNLGLGGGGVRGHVIPLGRKVNKNPPGKNAGERGEVRAVRPERCKRRKGSNGRGGEEIQKKKKKI